MKIHVTLAALALLACTAASAQYRYVAPDGTVTYSDQPPADNATHVSVHDMPAQPQLIAAAGLPYALSQATSRFPVTVYTGSRCSACDSARSYLKQRGIPFTEKTVHTDADVAVLKRVSGGSDTIPMITIGSQKASGYSQSIWGGMLDDAGYPATSVLPRDYTFPAPVSASGAPGSASGDAAASPDPAAAATPASNTSPAAIPAPPPATGNAPPGFKF